MPLRCPKYLEFLRLAPCSLSGREGHVCVGRVQAAHYRGSGDGGMGMKPGDQWAMPLCAGAHYQQHQIGEVAFEKLHRISMREICQMMWALFPEKGEIVIGRPKRRKYKITSPGFSTQLRRKINGKTVKRDGAPRMA